MIKKSFFSVCISIILIFPLYAANSLQIRDVKKWMDHLMEFHIEHKELKPLLVKRCMRLYIEQFDFDKTYLLKEEVLPYLCLNDEKAKAICQRWQKGDFSDFFSLNEEFIRAIYRARESRSHSDKEFLDTNIEQSRDSEDYDYANDNKELINRQAMKMHRLFRLHSARTPVTDLQRKNQVLGLIEKKIRSVEAAYLSANENNQALNILKAFAKSLDAHTAFFSEEEAFEMRMNLEKQFDGLGIVLAETIDGIMIIDLIHGSPAEKSGQIASNDIIVAINDKKVSDLSFEEVLGILKVNKEKKVNLTITRFSSENKNYVNPWNVTLQRQAITIEDERLKFFYEPFGQGVIGTLSLPSFYENSSGVTSEGDTRSAINQMKEKGELMGLILDLRENAGGFLNQAVKVASLFLSKGVIAVSKYSNGRLRILRNLDNAPLFRGPMIILTSQLSASASEIVAQVLQDYGVAVIVGDERTFGKGSVQYQTVTNERAEAFYKVTVGKYYTVSGKSTQIEGVKADILVPTHYACYRFGERYLEYPLQADTIPPLYYDSLEDVDLKAREWFEKNYFPFLQSFNSFWKEYIPHLKENSRYRLERNPSFSLFLKRMENPNSNRIEVCEKEDLQLQEAVNILKDMILIEKTGTDSY